MTTSWIAGKRVLIAAPAFYDWDLGTQVASILARLGARVETFGYSRLASRREVQAQLLSACDRFRPTVVFGLKLDQVEAATLRRIRRSGTVVVLWYVDCFGAEIPAWLGSLVRQADVFFTSAKGMVPKYAAMSTTPAHWIMEGVHLPSVPTVRVTAADRRLFGSQISFIGSVYHPSDSRRDYHRRARLFRRIGRDYGLTVWGRQQLPVTALTADQRCRVVEWPAYQADLVRICQSSEIMLGINFVNSIELYFSNRTFLTLAAGGFHLTHYVPGLETMFANHRHLVWFRSTPECLELIEYYLARPRLRRAIAAAGRRWVRRRYSMTGQINRMLAILEGIRG